MMDLQKAAEVGLAVGIRHEAADSGTDAARVGRC
jgi:hypothetical protein